MRKGVNPETIPRYELPREPEQQHNHCGDCYHCKRAQGQSFCVVEVFQADDFDQLEEADIDMVLEYLPVCRDFKELPQ